MSRAQLVTGAWQSFTSGDLDAVAAAFAPDATWRAVEDGPWNCASRDEITAVLASQRGSGLSGTIEGLEDVGERTVVAFRPDDPAPGRWPLDHGVRYVVLSFRGEQILEMKGCPTRAAALEYAAA